MTTVTGEPADEPRATFEPRESTSDVNAPPHSSLEGVRA